MLKRKLNDAQTAKELSQKRAKAQVASSPEFTDTELCLAQEHTSEEIIHKNLLLVAVVERKRERETPHQ